MQDRWAKAAGPLYVWTVSDAVCLPLPYVAVIVTVALVFTAFDVAVNVAEVAPAATVTLAGTVAADVLLLESVTLAPPEGAAEESVTVPVEFALPPTTLVGLSDSPLSTGALTVIAAVGFAEP